MTSMTYHEFLATLDHCPFCNPSGADIVVKNSHAYLTYSIAPYHADHLLVIPHHHIEYLKEISSEENLEIDALIKKGIEMLNKLGHQNISVIVREGMGSGKSIPHLHYHIVPDIVIAYTDNKGVDRKILSENERSTLTKRLKAVL